MSTEAIAIVGVGATVPRPVTPELSYKEIMYEAATRAYADAGLDPRQADTFMTCSEDFHEGTSIFDEYTPDQLGAVLKPVHTIGGDGIQGLAAAYLQLRTGAFEIAVVEAHSKASNILTKEHIVHYAEDPIYQRPLGLNPVFLAGLEMRRFLESTGTTRKQCAAVVVKNRRAALENPLSPYAARLSVEDVLAAPPLAEPLGMLESSPFSDAACVIVLATEKGLGKLTPRGKPIWIRGIGWATETPWIENRDWGRAMYAEISARMAYQMAGIENPRKEIALFEVDDSYAYKELQHLEALGVAGRGEAGRLAGLPGRLAEQAASGGGTPNGAGSAGLDRAGSAGLEPVRVNPSGGSLGMGRLLEASGLFRVYEIVMQLRAEAGRRQIAGAQTGLAQSWRDIPTSTGAVIILSSRKN